MAKNIEWRCQQHCRRWCRGRGTEKRNGAGGGEGEVNAAGPGMTGGVVEARQISGNERHEAGSRVLSEPMTREGSVIGGNKKVVWWVEVFQEQSTASGSTPWMVAEQRKHVGRQ